MVASVPLVLTFVKAPDGISYECQNRDTRTSRLAFAGHARGGLIGDRIKRRWIEREIRGEPGILGERQRLSEFRPLGKAARQKVGRFQRKFRRGPARGELCEFLP